MNALTIANTAIRQDAQGRYSFNDLHAAAVAAGHDYKTCQVEHFTRNDRTEALLRELRENGELEIAPLVSRPGRYGGTWGCKELVYAYAMWISPAFHLKVIRAYDQLVTAPQAINPATMSRLQLLEMAMKAETERLALEHKADELGHRVEVLEPKAQALDRIATKSDGSFCLTDAGKVLQMPPRKFTQWLLELGWIYRRPMGSGWLAYQPKIAAGLLEHKITEGLRPDGTTWTCTQVRVTSKGIARLAEQVQKAA